ncbi:hypothetical protein LXL04_036560 [Taraxacum kok-saghyz]
MDDNNFWRRAEMDGKISERRMKEPPVWKLYATHKAEVTTFATGKLLPEAKEIRSKKPTCINVESNIGSPTCSTVNDPKKFPSKAASGTASPCTNPATSPPRKLSPAPYTVQPSLPLVTTTQHDFRASSMSTYGASSAEAFRNPIRGIKRNLPLDSNCHTEIEIRFVRSGFGWSGEDSKERTRGKKECVVYGQEEREVEGNGGGEVVENFKWWFFELHRSAGRCKASTSSNNLV